MELDKSLKGQVIFKLFARMVFVDIVLIALAVIFYNGNFLFWQYPLSTSGVAYTYVESNSNIVSMYFFGLAMAFSALSLIDFGLKMLRQKIEKHYIVKAYLGFTGALGFLLTAFSPDDVRHYCHIYGMAAGVTAVWLIAFVYTAEVRRKIARDRFIAMELVLNLPLFAYAQAYFISFDPASYSFQKISLMTVCIVLLWSTFLYQKYFTVTKKFDIINKKT